MGNANDEVIKTRRSRVQEVHLYEVYEHEIEQLETGQDSPLFLTWGCALGSVGIGAILTLATATFQSGPAEKIAWAFATTGNILAALLLILWWKKRGSNKKVCAKIRERNIDDTAAVDHSIEVEENLQ